MRVILALIICVIITILNVFISKKLDKETSDDEEAITLILAGIVLNWMFLIILTLI